MNPFSTIRSTPVWMQALHHSIYRYPPENIPLHLKDRDSKSGNEDRGAQVRVVVFE